MIAVTQLALATTLLWSGAVLATAPVVWGQEIGAVCIAMACGVMVQLWTSETRKINARVVVADLMASAFGGFTVSVLGVPVCVGIINKIIAKCLSEEMQIQFDINNNTRIVYVLAGCAGMYSAAFLRQRLDARNPNWMNGHGTSTE